MNAIRSDSSVLVLVVDDDPAWLKLLETSIDDPRVRFVSESRHVLPMLENHDVAVVVTDTNMPHLNGIELLQEIRSRKTWESLPIVVLFSGLHGSTLTENHVLSLGATLVMTKADFLWNWQALLLPILSVP